MNQDPAPKKRTEIPVELDQGVYVVKKLPLRNYADLLKAVGGFSKYMDQFDSNTTVDEKNEKFIRQIMTIISDAMPEVSGVIEAATRGELKAEWVLDNLDGGEVVDLLLAIYEVNGLHRLFSRAKKAWANRTPQTPTDPKSGQDQGTPSTNGTTPASTSLPANTDGTSTPSPSPFTPTN